MRECCDDKVDLKLAKAFNLCTEDCFTILDSAPSVFHLKIKEALLIEWDQSSLNKQLFYFNVGLSV